MSRNSQTRKMTVTCRSDVRIIEIMTTRNRFAPIEKDRWERDERYIYEARFICPRCKTSFAVDTWLGVPYWKFCPMCGKPKEVKLL